MQGIGLNGVALQSAMTNEGRNVNTATAKCHNGWEQDMSKLCFQCYRASGTFVVLFLLICLFLFTFCYCTGNEKLC